MKLYWRVKINGKWTWRSADDMYEDDAIEVCECRECTGEEE